MPKVTRESAGTNGPAPARQASQGRGKTGSILDRAVDVGQALKMDQFFIFGETGTGKTRLACTWPKPLLLIGAEDGRESVKNVKGVKFFPLDTSDQITDIIRALQAAGESHYQTVVLDTVTALHAKVLARVIGIEEMPVQRSYNDASRDHYREASFVTKQHVRDLLRLAERRICRVVILAHEKIFKPSDEGMDPKLVKAKVMGAVGESVVNYINAECDYVLHTEVRNRYKETREAADDGTEIVLREPLEGVDYCLRLHPNNYYVVKFRAPDGTEVPEAIINPTYEKIRQLMDGQSVRQAARK